MLEDGATKTHCVCKHSKANTGNESHRKMVDIGRLLPEQMVALVNGETTMFLSSAQMGEEKVKLPMGAAIEVQQVPQLFENGNTLS